MNAKDAIKKQFMKEYIRKNLQDITIKSLCAATPTSRTTFYAYFDNTDDVIREYEYRGTFASENADQTICKKNEPLASREKG